MAKSVGGITDMTSGSAVRHILVFSIPLLIGNIFQQLYNMVDSLVVGRFVGESALAAVGTGFSVIFMMVSLFMGLGMGTSVMVSQYYGAKDFEGLRETVNTTYSATMVITLPIMILSMVLTDPLLRLIQVPPDTMPEARIYMLIIFFGMVGPLGYNINVGVLQGLGDSKTPLRFLCISCGVNIVLDLVFVLVIPMGVAGVAVATIIAQLLSWILSTRYINRHYSFLHIRPFHFQFRGDLFAHVLRIGIPSSIQNALFSVGMLAIQSLVNSYGSMFMAGYNAANKLDMLAFMPIQSFAVAVTTYVGQNIGAGRMDRIRHGTKAALCLSMSVCVVLGGLTILFARPLMGIFSSSPDVINAGVAYLYRILPFYWMCALFFILCSVMRGAGEAIVPMITSIFSLWLARVPAAYLLNHFFGRDSMFFCFAVGWILGDAIALFFYFKGSWKRRAISTANKVV